MSSAKAPKRRKRIYLVNRDFQIRYTRIAVLVGLISTILTTVIVLYPLYVFEILRIPRFLPLPILFGMSFAAVVNIVAIASIGILITHRLAGPMYSLVRSFRKVEMGHWHGEMRLRPDDDLRYLVRNFNAMIVALNRQGAADLRYLQVIAEDVKAGLDGDQVRLKQAQQEVETLIDILRMRINKQEKAV